MAPSTHKPPLHPGEKSSKVEVETYRLPRWDANGNLIDDRPKPVATVTEDIQEAEVKPPTAEEIRQIHDDAYNEGFESGYQQGMRQGQQEGHKAGHQEGFQAGEQAGRGVGEQAGYDAAMKIEEARIAEALVPLKQLLDQWQAVLPKQEAALQEGLVALAVRLTRNLFDAELALKPQHIQSLVHSAIQALPNADERLTVELHPDDLALVESIADSHWNLHADPQLSRGGCRIRSRFSYVDYSLEHRFRQQVSNLLGQAGLSERLEELAEPWPLPKASDTPADSQPLQRPSDEVISEAAVTAEASAAAAPAADPTTDSEPAADDHSDSEPPATDDLTEAAQQAEATPTPTPTPMNAPASAADESNPGDSAETANHRDNDESSDDEPE